MKQLAKVKPPENYYLHFKVKKDSLNSDKFGKNLNYPADAVWAELDTHRQAAYAALDDLTVMSATFASLVNNIDWNPLKAFLKNELSDAIEYGYRCLKGDEFERGRLTDQHEGPFDLCEAEKAAERLIEQYAEDFEEQMDKLAFLSLLSFWVKAIGELCIVAADQITATGNLDTRMKARKTINQNIPYLFQET